MAIEFTVERDYLSGRVNVTASFSEQLAMVQGDISDAVVSGIVNKLTEELIEIHREEVIDNIDVVLLAEKVKEEVSKGLAQKFLKSLDNQS